MLKNQKGEATTIALVVASIVLVAFGAWWGTTELEIGKSGEMALIELAESGHLAAMSAALVNPAIPENDMAQIKASNDRYLDMLEKMKAAWRKWDAEGKEYKGAFLDARKAFRAEQKAFVGLLVPYGIDVINQI